MRNGQRTATTGGRERIIAPLLATGLIVAAAGCNGDPKNRKTLDSGYKALEAHQYDQAIRDANAYLKAEPKGPGAAEAMYLRGRTYEERPVTSPAAARANWQSARVAYIDALMMKPAPTLEGYIRTSLGNVAYYQEDYATAAEQLSLGAAKLTSGDRKSMALARAALADQRLGRFGDADVLFNTVMKDYPGTAAAQLAREHVGERAFYVQVAAFGNAASADAVAGEIRRAGYPPVKAPGPRGLVIVRAGPFATYAQAMAARSRFTGKFPDAKVIP